MNNLFSDELETQTTLNQNEVELSLKSLLDSNGDSDKLKLERVKHVRYLSNNLSSLPSSMKSLDASRPWLIYWCLHSLLTLGVTLDNQSKARAINTLLKFQNPNGGFGGGNGQLSHLLTTYAAIMSFIIVGSPGDNNGWDNIDRIGIYNFLMKLKQADGSFIVHEGGEVDVRGCYCALTVATMLDILTPELLQNVDHFLSNCQTYEGGFAATCLEHSQQLGEAHGGYTSCAFCALTLVDSTKSSRGLLQNQFDLESLIRWSVHLQGLQSELGGFRGRTNKLVDGCYSWWVGGSFNLFDYWNKTNSTNLNISGKEDDDDDDHQWIDDDHFIFYNREQLQTYILKAAQDSKGGLRDKPGKNPDVYHTAYNLSGLSGSQHYIKFDIDRSRHLITNFNSDNKSINIPTNNLNERLQIRKNAYGCLMSWIPDQSIKSVVGGNDNITNPTHPIFNLTLSRTYAALKYFYNQ